MPLQPLVALAVFLGAAVLVARGAAAHHPYPRFGPANWVTTLRLALTAAVAGLVAGPFTATAAWIAIAITVAAGLLDGVDGRLARRSGLSSSFGARFDMETDALLILLLSVLAWRHDKAGAWVLLCGLMRYAFVAAGWIRPWLARPLRSTRRGKTVAALQLVGLGVALAPIVAVPVSTAVAGATLAALTWSFALDVAWLARQPAR
jgi:phosphatidylglycerophosphate synthase